MGMAFTFLAITYEFHQPVRRSIRSATTTSEGRKEIGDITLLSLSPSNHRSPYTRIFFPSLTLHFACILIIFLAFRMLFQAKEPEIDFALKIEEVGKYLTLNILKKRDSSSWISRQICFASIASLNLLKSLNPKRPSSLFFCTKCPNSSNAPSYNPHVSPTKIFESSPQCLCKGL